MSLFARFRPLAKCNEASDMLHLIQVCCCSSAAASLRLRSHVSSACVCAQISMHKVCPAQTPQRSFTCRTAWSRNSESGQLVMLRRPFNLVLAALALLLCGAFVPAAAHKSYRKHGTTRKLRCSPHKCPRAGRGGQPDPGPFAFAIIDNGNPPGDNTRFANSFTPDGVWTIPGADSLSSGPFVGPAEIEAAADRFSAAFADVKIEKLDAFYSAESGQKIVLEVRTLANNPAASVVLSAWLCGVDLVRSNNEVSYGADATLCSLCALQKAHQSLIHGPTHVIPGES